MFGGGRVAANLRWYVDTLRFTQPGSPTCDAWTGTTNASWNKATNWANGWIPGAPNVAQFGVLPIGTNGVGIDVGPVTGGAPGFRNVGAIEVCSSRTNNLLIGNTSTTDSGTLHLFGVEVNSVTNTVLRNNGGANVILTIQDRQGPGNQSLRVTFDTTGSAMVDATRDVVINSSI